MIQRVPTGISGFDELIEDGFPYESLILVAGSPGAGKTTLAAQFIMDGVLKYNEKGLYVCFAETKDSLLRNLSRFRWDLGNLERRRKISILDLSTTKEPGIQSNLNLILDTISDIGAKRLVIDSFTAFSMALTEATDIRFLIHLLYRFLQQIGCTTVMIADTPWGSQQIGSGVEEFIADGIILMQTKFDDAGNLKRTLSILKMRSTDHSKKTHNYDITDTGIQITT
ncbi:MAG: AAA family ATPase [Candidatus Bathyarchaeota archaeon]|jgi:circadian clock protein KaiC|nr:AAA family ATPase [Candidatus Bathyarchaeota archaeon]